jgi:hypothetical protein
MEDLIKFVKTQIHTHEFMLEDEEMMYRTFEAMDMTPKLCAEMVGSVKGQLRAFNRMLMKILEVT